jgi:hypothetical protein
LEELQHLSEKYYFFLKGIQSSKCALEDCEETRDEEEKKKKKNHVGEDPMPHIP